MDANKKLEMLELELSLTIDHATEVLEEYVNTLTEKILVDSFNDLSAENRFGIMLELLAETQQDLCDEDSVESAIEEAFKNIAKKLNPILKEQERRERLKEHEEDVQERLNRHIDEAIDEVISKKQERNRLLRLLNQNQTIIVL
jgi:hypothetical protein